MASEIEFICDLLPLRCPISHPNPYPPIPRYSNVDQTHAIREQPRAPRYDRHIKCVLPHIPASLSQTTPRHDDQDTVGDYDRVVFESRFDALTDITDVRRYVNDQRRAIKDFRIRYVSYITRRCLKLGCGAKGDVQSCMAISNAFLDEMDRKYVKTDVEKVLKSKVVSKYLMMIYFLRLKFACRLSKVLKKWEAQTDSNTITKSLDQMKVDKGSKEFDNISDRREDDAHVVAAGGDDDRYSKSTPESRILQRSKAMPYEASDRRRNSVSAHENDVSDDERHTLIDRPSDSRRTYSALAANSEFFSSPIVVQSIVSNEKTQECAEQSMRKAASRDQLQCQLPVSRDNVNVSRREQHRDDAVYKHEVLLPAMYNKKHLLKKFFRNWYRWTVSRVADKRSQRYDVYV